MLITLILLKQKMHGGPHDEEKHAGDLGNIETPEDEPTHVDTFDGILSLHGENSAIGRTVVIHAGEDGNVLWSFSQKFNM